MTGTGEVLPGERTPGRNLPGSDLPGANTPAALQPESATVTVDVTATGETTIGSFDGSRVTAVSVDVSGNYTGYDFNVSLGGVDLFDTVKSPSSSPDTFEATNEVVSVPSDKVVDATVDITTASTAGSPADEDITINVEVEDA